MNTEDQRPEGGGPADPRAELVAYALDAVDADERRTLDAAIVADPALAADLQAWLETAAELGAAVAEDPPERLRQAVLSAVAETPQEGSQASPLVGVDAQVAASETPEEPTPVISSRSQRVRTRVLAGLAAAATVAALAAGTLAWRADQRNDQLAAQQAAVVEVLSAPDAAASSADATGGGRGTVVSSAEQGQSVFVASDLPARPESQTYQLWLIGPDGAVSAGLVDRAGGDVTRLLDTPTGVVTTIGLSVEPAGGSPQPTDPVLLVPVT